MKFVLIIKTSSMGDIIHFLPALTDASRVFNDIQFDWVVETNFAEIPSWHPKVQSVMPIALRRWRKQMTSVQTWREVQEFICRLRARKYDVVIDAQGLLKSAWITYLSKGLRCGLNWQSAWEPLASLCYQKKYDVCPKEHAVTRMRTLMAKALEYPLPTSVADYGIDSTLFSYSLDYSPYILFFHGTTWQSKLWPEVYWVALGQLINQAGLAIVLAWGNAEEFERAQRIAAQCEHALVLPKLTLKDIAGVIVRAKGVVAVDTGLGHVTAALNVPCVSMYGPTSAADVGTIGEKQLQLFQPFECAPCRQEICRYHQPSIVKPACFASVTPLLVYQQLFALIESACR